jgi:hypothetical protein
MKVSFSWLEMPAPGASSFELARTEPGLVPSNAGESQLTAVGTESVGRSRRSLCAIRCTRRRCFRVLLCPIFLKVSGIAVEKVGQQRQEECY